MRKNTNKLTRFIKKWWLLCFVTLIPWLCILFYLEFKAQSRFVSRSDVVVKQVGQTTGVDSGGLGVLLGANNVSIEDARYLKEYILSLDMIHQLDGPLKLKQHFQGNGEDPVFDLPTDATQEELLEFFKKNVSVDLDEQSSILTITTQGFTPEFAYKLNRAIIAESENFINRISQQLAKDQLSFAQSQLAEAQNKLAMTKKALFDYQNTNKIVDPEANLKALGTLIATLEANLSALRTEERTLLSYLNPNAPQVQSIRTQISALEKQVKQEKEKLTSPNKNKLNRQAIQFESIKSEVEFSADLYKLSLASLEKARLEAVRKLKNLIIITSPQPAEEALYPRKAYVLFTSFVLLCMLYGFIKMVLSVIKDHRD